MKQILTVVLTLAMAIESGAAAACTNVFSCAAGHCLVGVNLDCSNVRPRIWFVPSTADQYGRYCYGTDESQQIAEGGVNDRGLFIGVNALDRPTGWRPDPALPDWEEWEGWYGTGVPDGILARCATVDDALEVFAGYNLLTLEHVRFLLADAAGDSRVVEWGPAGLVFLSRGAADYQVATNFARPSDAATPPPCGRYRIACGMLSDGSAPGFPDGMRAVLSATHLEFMNGPWSRPSAIWSPASCVFTPTQIMELMTGYGPMDILWLDGGWVAKKETADIRRWYGGWVDQTTSGFFKRNTVNQDIGLDELVAKARREQPGLIVVDRPCRARTRTT